MKIALVSDIHANWPAFNAVLTELEKENPDVWICLGDLVGYGPHPSECIEEVRKRNMVCVKGNHDAGLTGEISLKYFRNPNRRLLEHSRQIVTDDQKQWLKQLPLTQKGGESTKSWLAVHASPTKPEQWEYLESAFKMRPMLENLPQNFCFIGHTHRPALVSETIGLNEIAEGHKYFLNPGSVGQPRDEDKRASCGLLDLDAMAYKNIRVDYEAAKVLMDLENMGFKRREAEHLLRI